MYAAHFGLRPHVAAKLCHGVCRFKRELGFILRKVKRSIVYPCELVMRHAHFGERLQHGGLDRLKELFRLRRGKRVVYHAHGVMLIIVIYKRAVFAYNGLHGPLAQHHIAPARRPARYGDKLKPVFLGGQTEVFIAKDWGHQRNFSEEVAARVDKEIRRILEEQYDRAKTVLTEHRDAMERIVKALIEYEHIDGDDFEKLFKGEDVELETFSDRRARIEKADEEVLAKEKAEAEAKAAAEAQEQSADGEGKNK